VTLALKIPDHVQLVFGHDFTVNLGNAPVR